MGKPANNACQHFLPKLRQFGLKEGIILQKKIAVD
jgi:hypothetical protein